MIFSVAWRNVWRNKNRSLVVIMAITVGLFGTLFIISLTNGMVEQKISASINNEISHIQIHNKKFLQEASMDSDIGDIDQKVKAIRQTSGVKSACQRFKVPAMASTAASGTGNRSDDKWNYCRTGKTSYQNT